MWLWPDTPDGSRGGTGSASAWHYCMIVCLVFFFQAEDGIRDVAVTGVQTCALPICNLQSAYELRRLGAIQFVADAVAISIVRELGPLITAIMVIGRSGSAFAAEIGTKIGRASCRERV